MKLSGTTPVLAAFLLLLTASPAIAQAPTDDAAVWAVIEAQWQATEQGDSEWIESLLADDFVGWGKDSPAPRTKASVRMWQKFDTKQWDGVTHELYPLSIVVHGETAIAHYLYSNAGENSDGRTEVVNGRFTDVLVRIEGKWKFLSWHGGAD